MVFEVLVLTTAMPRDPYGSVWLLTSRKLSCLGGITEVANLTVSLLTTTLLFPDMLRARQEIRCAFWRERRAGRCEAPRRRRCRCASSRSGKQADERNTAKTLFADLQEHTTQT